MSTSSIVPLVTSRSLKQLLRMLSGFTLILRLNTSARAGGGGGRRGGGEGQRRVGGWGRGGI